MALPPWSHYPLILESYINLTTDCSQYQGKWICNETLYRLLNGHYPHLKNTFVFTREALNHVLSAKAGPCIAPNELSLYRAEFCTECPYSNQRRIVSFYFRISIRSNMCSGCYGYHSKNQPAPESLHKTWQKHQGPGSSSNRSRGRSISSWDHQHYHTKEKGALD